MHAVLSHDPSSAPAAGASVLEPLDGSPALSVTLWSDRGDAVLDQARSGGRRYQVEEVLSHGPAAPVRAVGAVASLTEFDGPRDAAQVHADRLSSRRIWSAVSQVPDVLGALVLRADDGAMAVLAVAASTTALEVSVRTLLSTPLLPDEDPALLTGPSRAVDGRLIGSAVVDLLSAAVPA